MTCDEVIKILRAEDVSFRLHKHDPVMTMKDVEEKLPFPKEKLLKTLVFRIGNSSWVLAILKGRDRVDYRKLAAAFGVNRRYLVKPSVEEVESQMGLQVGGICPIPISDNVKTVFDKGVLGMEIVYCGIGRNDQSLEIKLQDLLQVSSAMVRSIAH